MYHSSAGNSPLAFYLIHSEIHGRWNYLPGLQGFTGSPVCDHLPPQCLYYMFCCFINLQSRLPCPTHTPYISPSFLPTLQHFYFRALVTGHDIHYYLSPPRERRHHENKEILLCLFFLLLLILLTIVSQCLGHVWHVKQLFNTCQIWMIEQKVIFVPSHRYFSPQTSYFSMYPWWPSLSAMIPLK